MPSRRRRTDAATPPTRRALCACDGSNVLNRGSPDRCVHSWVRGLTARADREARIGARRFREEVDKG